MLKKETKISRVLRRNLTPWELKIWLLLRHRQILGYKFRRQHKIGKYIVDFCCPEKQLIIEIDGGQHNTEKGREKDFIRQKYLENRGFKIVRFWNIDIDNNIQGVGQKIFEILFSNTPHPSPLPKAERE
jgi:very-short-patch-repair endonuclease